MSSTSTTLPRFSRPVRITAVVLICSSMALFMLLLLGGCEGKAYDEELKREVTATEAISLAEKREARAIAEREKADAAARAERAEISAKAERERLTAAADAKDEIREAQAAAQRKTEDARLAQQRSAIEFRGQTAALEAEYKIKLGQLTQTFDISQAEMLVALQQAENGFVLAREKIGDVFERRVSAADRAILEAAAAEKEKLGANASDEERKLAANEADTNEKLKRIEALNARYMGIASLVAKNPAVSAAAGSVGINTSDVLTVLFGGTTVVSEWRRRKKESQLAERENANLRTSTKEKDDAWQEGYDLAKAEAAAAREKENGAFDEGQLRKFLLHATPPTTTT